MCGPIENAYSFVNASPRSILIPIENSLCLFPRWELHSALTIVFVLSKKIGIYLNFIVVTGILGEKKLIELRSITGK